MNEIAGDLDLQTLCIIGLGLVLGFVIVWSILSARSEDRAGKGSDYAANEKDGQET